MMGAVKPVKTLAPYLGGKHYFAKRIIPLIDATPHTTYAEVFGGMAGVFFRRTSRPRCEAINDINQDIVTLFRVVQRHPQALIDTVRWYLHARADFDRWIAQPANLLTDVERAARFLYLQRTRYGGKPTGVFSRKPGMASGFRSADVTARIEAMHKRLQNVQIDCLPYHDFIGRWDQASTVFFVDPPYWAKETYYGKGIFDRDDFTRLSAILQRVRGTFFLTLNDVPEVRELFAWANILPFDLRYPVSSAGVGKELLISNRDLPASLED